MPEGKGSGENKKSPKRKSKSTSSKSQSPQKKIKLPKYRIHAASGQARVWIRGRDYYLGPFGSPESWDKYHQLCAELVASNGSPPLTKRMAASLTIAELIERYDDYSRIYYSSPKGMSSEYVTIRYALGVILKIYPTALARDFGPLKLRSVRERMVEMGWSRSYINAQVHRIRRAFRWAVSEELLEPSVLQALESLPPLARGRTDAREGEPVTPAPESSITIVCAHVSSVIKAMIEIQLWTAARPGEVIAMRGCDIRQDGKIDLGGGESVTLEGLWVYQPPDHKTAYIGKRKFVLLGPKAQAILAPFIARRDPKAYLFSPAEARSERTEGMRSRRIKPLTQAMIDRREKRALRNAKPPKPMSKDRYKAASYQRSIKRACDEAGIDSWHPYQLRHNAATRITEEYGPDIARIVLGHSTISTTRRYIADQLNQAADAMRKSG